LVTSTELYEAKNWKVLAYLLLLFFQIDINKNQTFLFLFSFNFFLANYFFWQRPKKNNYRQLWPRRERLTYSPIVNGILESEGKIAGPSTPAMA